MKKIEKLLAECQKSLVEVRDSNETLNSLKLMNEEDRTQWVEGEWDALMFTIDRAYKVYEDATKRHWINNHLRDEAIYKLSSEKKTELILSLLDVELPF